MYTDNGENWSIRVSVFDKLPLSVTYRLLILDVKPAANKVELNKPVPVRYIFWKFTVFVPVLVSTFPT